MSPPFLRSRYKNLVFWIPFFHFWEKVIFQIFHPCSWRNQNRWAFALWWVWVLSLALTILETGTSDPLAVPKYKVSKMVKNGQFLVPSPFWPFREASRRGWEPLVGRFVAHNMHMLLRKTHPVWTRFSDASDGRKEKRAIFHFLFKFEKNRFLQVTKVDRSQQRGEILEPHLSHRHITKMPCSHLQI